MEDYRAAQEALKKGLDGSEKKLKAFAFSLKKYVKSRFANILLVKVYRQFFWNCLSIIFIL